MNIENEVFKRFKVDYKKLIDYGFVKENNDYLYEKEFFDNDFKAIIKINKNEIIGKVIDLVDNSEYTNLRLDVDMPYVNKVRELYKEILIDIRDHCFNKKYFIYDQANRLTNYIIDKYKVFPEFLWEKYPYFCIFRNQKNNKWFALVTNIDRSKLENGSGEVEVLNIKLGEDKINDLIKQKGFYLAYHMKKKDWVSIIMDDTIPDKDLFNYLDLSYNNINTSESWLVPANPKYYDIINCFNDKDEIIWKQSSNINIDDYVYLYVCEPYKKIMYKCKVIEVNIPYEYKDKNVSMNKVMKIKLIEKMDKKNYDFNYLNKIGIKMIRGPRKISKEIENKLK